MRESSIRARLFAWPIADGDMHENPAVLEVLALCRERVAKLE
jgi:hypothetical protein